MGEYKRVLGRHIRKGLKYPIGAFDIETIPRKKGESALYGLYADGFLKYEDDSEFYRCRTLQDLWDRIISRKNVILYAHNFRGYESNYLLDVIPRDQKMQVILQGDNSVIGFILEFEDGIIEIRDSLALIPMPLKKATKAFGTTAKGDIGLGKGEIYDPDNKEHQEYCKNDVQCTIEIVQKCIEMQGKLYGCGIGWTAASTAMAAWRSTIPRGYKYHRLPKYQEIFCREGYYGGFVYPGQVSHKHGETISIDRNAAYAAVMMQPFPVGKGRYTTIFEEDKLGIYEIKVRNEGKFPVLPYRTKNNLMWPQGTFKTICTSEEIAYARTLGIDIEIEEGLVWDKVEFPFELFLKQCEFLEYQYPDLKEFIKLLRNALYGKFGSKFTVYEARVTDEILEGWKMKVDPVTGEITSNLWLREKENEAEHIQPHWAAFVTARQRLWLFKTIHTVGVDSVYYCDTDSVKAEANRVRQCIEEGLLDINHQKYGACKIDEHYKWFQCLGPKVYHGELLDGSSKMRAKGVSGKYLSTMLFDDAYRGVYKEVKFVDGSANSTFVRMKRGLPMQREIARKMTNRLNSKSWNFREDGTVSPIYLK
jgi:hypothetical protein